MATGYQDAGNVSATKPRTAAGIAFSAPMGVTVPTDAFTPLPDEFRSLGYMHDDGITNGVESDSETINALGGDTVLTVMSSSTETYVCKPIEQSEAALAEVWGHENVSYDHEHSQLVVLHNAAEREYRVYVFDIAMNNNRVKRIVIPKGKVTEIGEESLSTAEPMGHEITISCEPDALGNRVYEYIASKDDDPYAAPRCAPISEGTYYGIDAAELGTYTLNGTTFTGTSNKVTVPNFDGEGRSREGHFIVISVNPHQGVTFHTSTGHDGEMGEDDYLMFFLGADKPERKTVTFTGKGGDAMTYAVDATAAAPMSVISARPVAVPVSEAIGAAIADSGGAAAALVEAHTRQELADMAAERGLEVAKGATKAEIAAEIVGDAE